MSLLSNWYPVIWPKVTESGLIMTVVKIFLINWKATKLTAVKSQTSMLTLTLGSGSIASSGSSTFPFVKMPTNTRQPHHAEKSFTVTQIYTFDCNFIAYFLCAMLKCTFPLFSQLPSLFPRSLIHKGCGVHQKAHLHRAMWTEDPLLPFLLTEILISDLFVHSSLTLHIFRDITTETHEPPGSCYQLLALPH